MQGRMRVLVAAGAAALASLTITQPARADTVLSGTTTADNAFFAFISTDPTVLGTQIGSGNNWPSSFPVLSSTLGPGTYYLQIEAINYGGPAGFSGVFNLSGNGLFGNGTQTLTTDPANLAYWLGSYNSGNSSVAVQPWVTPTGAVLQATSYSWGNVAGTANWIWPSDAQSSPNGPSGPCDSCTVDFMAQFSVPGSRDGVPEPATWAMMLLGFCAIGLNLRRSRERSVTRQTLAR